MTATVHDPNLSLEHSYRARRSGVLFATAAEASGVSVTRNKVDEPGSLILSPHLRNDSRPSIKWLAGSGCGYHYLPCRNQSLELNEHISSFTRSAFWISELQEESRGLRPFTRLNPSHHQFRFVFYSFSVIFTRPSLCAPVSFKLDISHASAYRFNSFQNGFLMGHWYYDWNLEMDWLKSSLKHHGG